MLFFINRG